MNTTCPICDGSLQVEQNIEVSEVIRCKECNSSLVVESVKPISLTMAPAVEEDWGE